MEEDLSPNEDVSVWDIYGRTPPRTKILRKNRERKQKFTGVDSSVSKPHKSRHQLMRRNTVSTMYDELIANADKSDSEQGHGSKKMNKRHMKLLRGSERDLKLDIASAQTFGTKKPGQGGHGGFHHGPKTPLPSYHIESGKRFMSLMCRTVACHKQPLEFKEHKNGAISTIITNTNNSKSENNDVVCSMSKCPKTRVDFYQTLSMLIRMGGGKDDRCPRRGMSREESIWQNELKDLIWLELQAFHADRTPIEEDEYLCMARQSVEPLLQYIMNYKFQRHSRRYSSQNSDSGLEDDCPGCISIYCVGCMEAQNEALKEIEGLMKRLEDIENLFPSSKAFAELYPLYNSPKFVSRVKSISLWFNMTKIQRLKLNILARLVLCLESKHENWPVLCDDITSGSSSDSNSSIGSSMGESCVNRNDMYNVLPLAMLISKKDEKNVSPYRRYIENILKTRALYKSINFLDSLHQNVLYKAQVTIEKPPDMEIFNRMVFDTQEEELIRFGSWSPEAKAIGLPPYGSMFLFLAGVPLEVIKEYLQMRLEQKPENPSPLSVRQLMRELKEGLRIAARERERIEKYTEALKSKIEKECQSCHQNLLQTFDECMVKVFKDYLEYLEQWVLYHHNTFQKSLLEDEFYFSLAIVKFIENGNELLVNKYANILGTILERIAERLLKRIDEFLSEIKKDDVNTLKQTVFAVCREFQTLFNEEREMSMKTMAFTRMIFAKSFDDMELGARKFVKNSVIAFKCIIPEAIAKVQSLFDYTSADFLDDIDRAALTSRIREILMQIYRFGFEFYKEMTAGAPSSEYRLKLITSMVHFAKLWMTFVTERCERGRGMRPRWANQGMEFLLTVCEPAHTSCLTEEEFEDLKKNMDECISHLIGTTAPNTPESGFYSGSPRMSLEHIRVRSRGSSPSPRATYKSQRPTPTRKTSAEQQSPNADSIENLTINFTNLSPSIKRDDKNVNSLITIKLPPRTYSERVRDAIETLESKMDDRLYKEQLIGKCLAYNTEQSHVRRRNVTFSWQRGIKIGQGRFGKVYTAVNNNNGEMMAVKEIPIQHNDSVTIKRLSEEVKILEGINHENLVKYYGVEVYTDKMLLFMEFCAEGTLESLINATENGLPELLVRKYTYQLLSGVACLHDHGIVHRDIKPANIFLTQEGNCLKIGDFGCAAKIKSNVTMPGELKGFVGTQAYMAPEVFTKNMNEGHGRAADIWSVGCVVVEMASGKRPWAQYDSNYQIMFKVGMGQSPDPPDNMIDEGLDFLELCFKHNPKERETATELLAHNFVKVGDDLI